ncbi:hypothetical protein [uncultured Sphingomonas sp.]|uniref:hypothetical protein n=1 Tax=uncultured Sphingomonas sp. TaxID=158754 RepID=UPI0035C94A32
MLRFSEINVTDRCCLCGSADDLTGEHKIKATTLRSLFGNETMMIGHFNGTSRPRLAQSATSKAVHFRVRLCGPCNSTRTQAADVEFARFDDLARRLQCEGADPASAFDDPRYAVGSAAYLNVFRYLAKLLACHIAEVGGPRLRALTDFALSRSDMNVVRLSINADPDFQRWFEATGDPQFAGHGGLGIDFSRSTRRPKAIYTSLSHGPLRYRFSVAFGFGVALALRLLHPEFYQRSLASFEAALGVERGSNLT